MEYINLKLVGIFKIDDWWEDYAVRLHKSILDYRQRLEANEFAKNNMNVTLRHLVLK